jgi:hypothetical protein
MEKEKKTPSGDYDIHTEKRYMKSVVWIFKENKNPQGKGCYDCKQGCRVIEEHIASLQVR